MGWSIGLIANTVEVDDETAEKLFKVAGEEFFYDVEDVTYEGNLCFNDDHMEHMDYLSRPEIRAVLTEAKVTGRVAFASVEGDDRGTWWSYDFRDGECKCSDGKLIDLIP